MKKIIITIATILIVLAMGTGVWLLAANRDAITNKANDIKNSTVKEVSDSAKQKILDQAQSYKPEGLCTTATTPARHTATGVEFTFPTGCIPSGWEKI